MIRVALPALLLLAGCATTSTADLRQTPIVATYASAKPAAEVAACLAEALTKWGSPSVYVAGADTAVSFTTAGNTMLLFLIGPGGQTTVRRAGALVDFRSKSVPCF
jgi:hypothetical protein